MFSPLVFREMAAGNGEPSGRLRQELLSPLATAKLCSSLLDVDIDGVASTDNLMTQACRRLLEDGFVS